MKIFNSFFNQLTAMPKRLAMVLTVLFTISVGSMWAEDVTLQPSSKCWTTTTGAQTGTIDGITISTTNGQLYYNSNNNPTQFRISSGATFSVTSSVGNITKIAFTFTNSSYHGGLQTSYTDINSTSWSATLTGAARIQKIVVTYTGGSTPEPNPEPGTGGTGTINFNSNAVEISAASVTGEDNLGKIWTITTQGTTYYSNTTTHSQIGSSNNPATSITFTTTLPSEGNITAFSAKFGGFSGTAGTITLKVDDTSVGTGSLNAANDVTVSNSSQATGKKLTVTVTGIARGVKVYYISYTTSSAEPTQLPAPTELKATNVTHNSATLSWKAVDHAIGYKVNINNKTYQVDSRTTSQQVTDLDPGKSYGWSVTAIGNGTTYTDSEPETSDVITKPVYTVNYDLNDGEGTTPTETEKAEGEQFTLATADKITKSGYSFSGWNDGTNTYAAGATYTMPAKEVTFKAQWSALPKLPTPTDLEVTNKTSTSATFSWTVNGNASSYSLTINNQTYHVTKSNIPYKVTGLTKNSSYGWSVQAIGDGKTYSNSDKATSNVITLNSYTVTFDANGHGTAPAEQIVDHGGKATRPTAPTAEGVTFAGWFKEAACTNQFNFSEMTITSDIRLYAKWNIATYTVKWFVGGEERQSKTYNHGEALVLPTADLNCGGKTPIGWSEREHYEDETTAPDGFFSTANSTVTADKKYYAIFADVNGSGGNVYEKVTSALDDWSGDYLIAYNSSTFADGRIGGTGTDAIGASGVKIDLTSNISNNSIPANVGDTYSVTLEEVSSGYVLKTQDGKYNYQSSNATGITTTTAIATAAKYAINVIFTSENDIKLALTGNAAGAVFRYNTSGFFRFYKDGGQQAVYLYKKNTGGTTYTNYTTECTNAPKLDAPTDLTVSDLSCSSVTLSWTTVANASGYEVVRTLNAHNTTYTTDEPSITIEGLTGGLENAWKVRAMGDGVNHGNSDYTTGDNFTTRFSVKYYVDEALWHGCDNGCADNGGSFEICETTPTKANYDFAGWAIEEEGNAVYQAGGTITNIQANITLYAVWTLSNHTVNWSVNGQDNKVTYPHGQDLALPSISITPCVDMEHVGWTNEMVYVHNTDLLFTEAEGTVTSDTAFYAVFATPHTSTGEPTTTTLDFTAKGYKDQDEITSASEGAIKVTFDKGTNSNAPKYYNNGEAIRIYGGGYFTVSSENTISNITITFGSSDGTNAITTDCGTYSNGTWTGSAKSIKFTIGGTSGNRRIRKLAVTSAGTSKYHNGHTTTCDTKTIANPTNLKATYITYNGAILTWEEVGARTYSISIDGKTYETNHNAITITGLKEKTTYTWSVQAKGNGSNYLHSDIVNGPSFTTGTALELTWSVSAKKHHTTITLGQPIGKLPSYPVPNGCAGKYFIGWTTTNSINNDGTGITYITSDETPLVPTTYYAVYATPEGNAAGAKLFQESFTANDGTGGNDDNWSGNIASSKLDSYGNWEELQYVYKGYQCIKLGTGSGLGEITTPALGINGSATLTFKAGAWNGSEEKLNILVTIVGNGSIEPSSFTLTKGEFNDYNANITGADENTKVTFAATNNSDNRFFLDEVIVTDGSSITYTDYTTSCGDFLVTFYGFTGGYSTTCNENPGEIAVPQGSTFTIPNCTPDNDPLELGRTFAGTWYTKPDGTGTEYKPGDSFTVNDNITLYGKWLMSTKKDITLPTGNEVLANTDIVVNGGTTLTLAEGTTTIKSLTLKGGIQSDGKYQMPNVWIPEGATLVRKDTKIYLDLIVNADNYYPFAVPFATKNDNNVDYLDPVLNKASTYGTHFVIKTYDGEARANKGEDREHNWVKVNRDTDLQPGVGYIITAMTYPDIDTATIRIPMTVSNDWFANGEQVSITVNETTTTRNTVAVTAHSGTASQAVNGKRHAGWNFVASPYLSKFAGKNIDNEGDLRYINGAIHINGEFAEGGEDVPYVTVPAYDFSYYMSHKLSEVVLNPEWSFFVQIGTSGTMNFTTAGRQQAPAAVRANAPAENPRIEANLAILSNEVEADHTGLIIDDRYTSDYEIGADLEKMFGSAYNTTIYTIGNSTRLAYNALPHSQAQLPIPLGFRAAEDGEYTISLTNYDEISGIERIELHDLYTGEKTNLLYVDYRFYTDQTQDDNRFVVYLVPRNNTTTDLSTIIDEAQNSENRKVLINNHLYIIHNGKVYNGAGQIVK